MNPQSSLYLKAICTLLVVVCAAAQVGEIIAQEQASPLDLRHGYRMVLFDEHGHKMTWEQFQSYSGRLRWEIHGEGTVPEYAQNLFDKGRGAGAKGDFATALELFEEAHQNAPGWLYPIYEMAWTHLLAGDPESALKQYRRVNQLAPQGFFNCLQAADCLGRERRGEVAAGTYKRLVLLERASRSTAGLVVRGILDKSPDLPVALERLAYYSDDPKEARAAIEKGLASKPDPFTRDSLRFRQAILSHNEGHTADAIRMLERQLRGTDLTLSIEAQIKIVLPGLRRDSQKKSNTGE